MDRKVIALSVYLFCILLVLWSGLYPLRILYRSLWSSEYVVSPILTDSFMDYFSYLSYIQQGMSGSIFRYSPYTSQGIYYSINHSFYSMIGLLFHSVPVRTDIIYLFLQVTSVGLFLVLLPKVVTAFTGVSIRYYVAGIALLTLWLPAPLLKDSVDITWHPYGYFWWWQFSPFSRLIGPPHYMFGYDILLFIIILLFGGGVRRYTAFVTSILNFIGVFIFPPILFITIFVLGIWGILGSIGKKLTRHYQIILISCIAGGLGMALLYGLQMRFMHASNLIRWESEFYNKESFIQTIGLFGLLPMFAAMYFVANRKHISLKDIFLLMWALVPSVALILPAASSIPKIRLLQVLSVVPLSILGGLFLQRMARFGKITFVCLLLLLVLPNYFSWVSYETKRVDAITSFVYQGKHGFIFPSKTEYALYRWVSQHVPPKSAFLSYERIGNTLPAYAPVTSHVGHPEWPEYLSLLTGPVTRYFRGEMSESEACTYLREHNIAYVFYGRDELIDSKIPKEYSCTRQEVKENDAVIFRVQFTQ